MGKPLRRVHSLWPLATVIVAAVAACSLAVLTSPPSVAPIHAEPAQPAPAGTPPTLPIPGSATIAPGATVMFSTPPPARATAAPGQPTLSPAPGCGSCPHVLSIKNATAQPISASLESGGALRLSIAGDFALQLRMRQLGYGSGLEQCATVSAQLNQVHCQVRLGPPLPSLGVTVTAVPAAEAGDQRVELPDAHGNTAVLFAPAPAPDAAVPVLALSAPPSGRPATVRWVDGALQISTPLGTTAAATSAPFDTPLDCTQDGAQSDQISCTLPNPLPQSVSVQVVLPAGWHLIAAPGNTAPNELAPLYTFQAGDADYETFPAGSPLPLNAGYWAYLPTPAPPRAIATAITSVSPLPVPSGQAVIVGNALYWPATVSGATAIYRYDPAAGYIPVDPAEPLAPGEAAWVYATGGSVSLVPLTPTPVP